MPRDTGLQSQKAYSDTVATTVLLTETKDVLFQSVPHAANAIPENTPVWRVIFGVASEEQQQFGLAINGEVILGRDANEPQVINLKQYAHEAQGVSRHHLMLRPSAHNLFAIDLGSTNGTLRNGRSMGVNNPHPINNGDVLDLGGTQLILYIMERPTFHSGILPGKPSQTDALAQIAKALTSQLDLDQVLNKVIETAYVLTDAGETAIWLLDEQSGELFLEVEKGIEDEQIRRMRLPVRGDNPAGKVIQSGQPLRAFRKPGEEQIKVKTGYLVESLVYVPITLGGITFGVVAAGQRQPGKPFSQEDERLLGTIADFAAIAIQNARLFQATDKALERRVKELSALNQISHAVSTSLDLSQVYNVLVDQLNLYWPVDAVLLYLYSERRNGLYRVRFDKDGGKSETINRGLMWYVFQNQCPIITNDARQHPAYVAEADMYDGLTPQSLACVPLLIKEREVGTLALINRADGLFTNEDISRLQAFANPIATAIENARLFAESRRQQAAIQATAHTIPEPLIILDEHGRVLVSNRAAQTLLEQHMGQLFDGISRTLGRTTEIAIGERTFLTTAHHMAEVGTIVVMQDITYVKQLEKDRAEFMRALSHDLKSPLTSIKGFAQLLSKVITLNEKSERFVNQIVSSSDRMLNMINQLLLVTRDEAIEPDRGPCQLERVVAEVLHDVEGNALHKSIRLEYELQGEAYQILADQTRLYHALLNLVDNAIKYSPEETAVHITLLFGEATVTVCVQDEGPGIPDVDLPHIFDKYYRGVQATQQPGSGVGLSVVWAIVDAHGGQVLVRNVPDKGAEFTITLPGTLRLGS